MKYSKQDQLLCFTIDEIKKLFRDEKLRQFDERVRKGEFNISGLYDRKKMEDIASKMSESISKSKEEVEIFCAIYLLEEFHIGDAHICFFMKDSFDPKKEKIITFDSLKKNTKENSLIDFLFFSGSESRAIQFKQYKGNLNDDDLFDFINKKIDHYGGDLDQVNLLIMLQSINGYIKDPNFKNLNERLVKKGLTFEGEILLSYNSQNEKSVITRIYPTVAHKITPFN